MKMNDLRHLDFLLNLTVERSGQSVRRDTHRGTPTFSAPVSFGEKAGIADDDQLHGSSREGRFHVRVSSWTESGSMEGFLEGNASLADVGVSTLVSRGQWAVELRQD